MWSSSTPSPRPASASSIRRSCASNSSTTSFPLPWRKRPASELHAQTRLNLHRYAALVAGVFVIILGLTGSVMVFEERIDRLLHPVVEAAVSGGPKPLAAQTFAATGA
ncbi:MAG TPA: PepSY-associated TM helix domain-containing protein [Bryobacterales bacterium]|nr:PepSY-associated TM helix domain-containing protein [Bryobacterales bacterium]